MANKFLFETSFEPRDIAERDAAIPAAIHQAALKAEYQKAFEEGRVEAQAGIDAQNTEQLQEMNTKLIALINEQELYRDKVQTVLGEVLKESLAKLFPALAEKHGLGEILKVVTETFDKEKPAKEMGVFVRHETLGALQEKLETLSKGSDQDVVFKVQEDPNLSYSDCRLTWEGGGIERLCARLHKEIEDCLDRLQVRESLEVEAQGDVLEGGAPELSSCGSEDPPDQEESIFTKGEQEQENKEQ